MSSFHNKVILSFSEVSSVTCSEYLFSAHFQHETIVCTETQQQRAVCLALKGVNEMNVSVGYEVVNKCETCYKREAIL